MKARTKHTTEECSGKTVKNASLVKNTTRNPELLFEAGASSADNKKREGECGPLLLDPSFHFWWFFI